MERLGERGSGLEVSSRDHLGRRPLTRSIEEVDDALPLLQIGRNRNCERMVWRAQHDLGSLDFLDVRETDDEAV